MSNKTSISVVISIDINFKVLLLFINVINRILFNNGLSSILNNLILSINIPYLLRIDCLISCIVQLLLISKVCILPSQNCTVTLILGY